MHPDRREQDEVEGQAEAAELDQLRQGVGPLMNARRRMQRARMVAHGIGGLDGDDIIATGREPRGVATSSRQCARSDCNAAGTAYSGSQN